MELITKKCVYGGDQDFETTERILQDAHNKRTKMKNNLLVLRSPNIVGKLHKKLKLCEECLLPKYMLHHPLHVLAV